MPPDRLVPRPEYLKLPRLKRIMLHVLNPRNYWLEDRDLEYFELMKGTFTILQEHADENLVEGMVKQLIPHELLRSTAMERATRHNRPAGPNIDDTFSTVREIIRDTKEFFGKTIVRDADFDREIIRRRLWKLADRAKETGDLLVERQALKELAKLEDLNKRKIKDAAPEIPAIPSLEITTDQSALHDAEPAVIISGPDETEDLG